MYAIVKDIHSGFFWIEGDEGRVGGVFGWLTFAHREVIAMAKAGYEVDTEHYYTSDPNDGVDWDSPISIRP